MDPVTLTVAAALADYRAGTLPPLVAISDLAGRIAAHLDFLQLLATKGYLASIQFTGKVTSLTVKAAQVTTDAQALAAIQGPYRLVVRDTAANVTAALLGLETAAQAGKLTQVILTDAGTPVLTPTETELKADRAVFAKIRGVYSFAVQDVLAADAVRVARLRDVTSISVRDSAADVQKHLSQLEALVFGGTQSARSASGSSGGSLTSITLTDGGVPVLTLSDSQVSSDAGVLGLIASPFGLDVTGVTAADAASLASNPIVQSLSVADTAVNIAAALGGLEAAAVAGKIASVVVTSGTFATDDVSDAAFSLYGKFIGSSGITFSLTPNETVNVLDTGNLANYLQNGPLSYNIQVPVNITLSPGSGLNKSDIFNLQNGIDKGYIASIASGTTTVFGMSITDLTSIDNQEIIDTVFSNGSIIYGFLPANVNISEAIQYYSSKIAAAIETRSIIVYNNNAYIKATDATMIGTITDSAQNLQTELDTLATALNGRTLTAPIQLTDPLPPTITLSAAQAVADAVVLNAVTSSYLLSIQGSAEQLNNLNLSALTNQKIELTLTSLDQDVTVNGAGILDVNLAALAAPGTGITTQAYSSGGQTGTEIDLTGTDGQAHKIILIGTTFGSLQLYAPLDAGTFLGAHGTQVTGGLTVAAALTAPSPVAVTDTAANVAAGLDALQGVVGNITGVGFTDPGTPVLTLTEAQLTSDQGVLALLSGSYSLAVGGVDTAHALAIASANDVSSISLTDSTANIVADLNQLEEIDKAGKLTSITLTDPGTSLGTISASQIFADADVLRLIEADEPDESPGMEDILALSRTTPPPVITIANSLNGHVAIHSTGPAGVGAFASHMASALAIAGHGAGWARPRDELSVP